MHQEFMSSLFFESVWTAEFLSRSYFLDLDEWLLYFYWILLEMCPSWQNTCNFLRIYYVHRLLSVYTIYVVWTNLDTRYTCTYSFSKTIIATQKKCSIIFFIFKVVSNPLCIGNRGGRFLSKDSPTSSKVCK